MILNPSAGWDSGENPYVLRPTPQKIRHTPVWLSQRLQWPESPSTASALEPKQEDPFLASLEHAGAEPAATDFHAIWIKQIDNRIQETWNKPAKSATTWLRNALKELESIDDEALEDELPTIKAETKREARRILRVLDGQTIQPTIYPAKDGGVVIHFQPPRVQAVVLIELTNNGHGAWFSHMNGANRRARSDDSSDLPDTVLLAQLRALAEQGAI